MDMDIFQKAIALRHELHAHPELSGFEIPTKNRIMEFLRENTSGLEIRDMGKWFYAACRSGTERPAIAFRADIDALPIEDKLDRPYASTVKGVGHKCGHDGHAASLAAFAMEVDRHGADRDVFFLFQHAEETGEGAAECCKLLELESVGEIYGFHNRPSIPLGTVQVRDGTVYCGSTGVIFDFRGTPSHASMPELGRNPAYAIAEIITDLGQLQKGGEYRGLVMATIIQVDIGERAFGIQASRGKLLLTVRGEYEEELKRLLGNLNRMARNLAERYGLDLDISYCDTFPNTVSHKACNDKIRRICAARGIPIREMPEPRCSSEDFGHYTKIIPGAFFEIGAGEDCPELHTEGYDFPDAVMATAVELYLDLIK